MPKRGKESRPTSHHSGGRFSPPQPPASVPLRQPRIDYPPSGPSRSTSDSSSGRRSPHPNDIIKQSSGNTRHGNSSNRVPINIVHSPIILTDDDDDDDYKNLDTTFRENGNKSNSNPDEGTRIVKHFVPSADRYHISHNVPEKPVFRGPETDVLRELEKDQLKNIRVQMIRADVQQNDSCRKSYVVDDQLFGNKSKEPSTKRKFDSFFSSGNIEDDSKMVVQDVYMMTGDKNNHNFDDKPAHFNSNQMVYSRNNKNYRKTHSLSPPQIMSRDRSLSPRVNIGRPPSPPLPYSPDRNHFSSDNVLRRERPKRSPERSVHEHLTRHSSSIPPEPRSPPDAQRFRSNDHIKHRGKDDQIHYENRPRRSRSPGYFENHYRYRSPSPNVRPFSPKHAQLSRPMSPPSSRELSPHSRDRPSYRRRRTSPPRRERSRDRSRERRRRGPSPRRRTSPPSRSPLKRRENGNKRSKKNQESRKRESKDGKSQSQSKTKSITPQQEQQQTSFQQPQPQPLYPLHPGIVRLPPPPRPFPPGPMLIPLRPPPYPPPMGAWRHGRPPMQPPPPSGWPYPPLLRAKKMGRRMRFKRKRAEQAKAGVNLSNEQGATLAT